MNVLIHKNEIFRYVVDNWRDCKKIGDEIVKKWIDIPEYMEVSSTKTTLSEEKEIVKIVMEKSGMNNDYYPVFIDINGDRWIHKLGFPDGISYWKKEENQ